MGSDAYLGLCFVFIGEADGKREKKFIGSRNETERACKIEAIDRLVDI